MSSWRHRLGAVGYCLLLGLLVATGGFLILLIAMGARE